jgi:phosphoribosylglycinamide formyltransferase-1
MPDADQPLALVVLISGRGSNLRAILDAIASGTLPARVRAVISTRADAPGLDYARKACIDTLALSATDYPDKADYDRALQGLIDQFQPELVVLAGFMRILSAAFVRHYRGRLVNIHPSLLPALGGLNTHQRALDAGLSEHGASVHFVTEDIDGGPVIAQARVAVLPGDDAATLAARVLRVEHPLYVQVLRWFAQGKVQWNNGSLLFDGEALARPVPYEIDD